MVDKNYEYFEENLAELVKVYDSMFVVIKDCGVIGAYGDFDEAYAATIEKEELGNFIIQRCSSDALLPTARFAWNNIMVGSVAE